MPFWPTCCEREFRSSGFRVGSVSIQMTFDTYGNLLPGSGEDSVVDALEQLNARRPDHELAGPPTWSR